jgi:hypothetical protein
LRLSLRILLVDNSFIEIDSGTYFITFHVAALADETTEVSNQFSETLESGEIHTTQLWHGDHGFGISFFAE